jgi:chromosome segregation ATPase
MSLLSLITAAVAAKLLPANPDVEATKRIAELERENKELQARLERAREDVRGWETIAHSWRTRYEATDLHRQHQLTNAAMQRQYAMTQADYGDFCNCVPSRAQVWAA